MKKKIQVEINVKNKILSFDKLIKTLSKEILEDKIKCVQ